MSSKKQQQPGLKDLGDIWDLGKKPCKVGSKYPHKGTRIASSKQLSTDSHMISPWTSGSYYTGWTK